MQGAGRQGGRGGGRNESIGRDKLENPEDRYLLPEVVTAGQLSEIKGGSALTIIGSVMKLQLPLPPHDDPADPRVPAGRPSGAGHGSGSCGFCGWLCGWLGWKDDE